jgi:drug/metabolite transporter (DMT)-like permease
LIWGGADYCGGRATRSAPALGITVASQIAGLVPLAVVVALLGGSPRPADLAWGVGAGAAGLVGLVLLYRGLSTGAMAIVAPITAVTGALIPLVVGLLTQRTPSALALSGAFCAVLAIALVSLSPSSAPTGVSRATVIGLALASGAMFGAFFSLFAQTNADAGMWPLVGARGASVLIGLAALGATRGTLRPPRAVLGWVIVAGIGDVTANGLYLLASRQGLLSVLAPIAALYPVSTVLLALTVDKERVRVAQMAGLGLAAVALVLTAVPVGD